MSRSHSKEATPKTRAKSESKKAKTGTKAAAAAESRKKVALLYFLCQQAGVNIENELAEIIPLIANKLGESDSFKATDSETLNQYKLCEKIPYTRVKPANDSFLTPFELTESELEQLSKETYIIEVGHSLLDDIKHLIIELGRLAAPKDRKVFTEAKDSISAKVSESTKEVAQSESAKEVVQAETADNKNTDHAPEGNDRINHNAILEKDESESIPEKADAETVANTCDPYAKAIELSAKEKLPVFFDQGINKPKVKAGIYCNCRIYVHGKHKVSKRAIFIDCTLA